MKKNVGKTDQWIRIAVGIAALLVVVFVQSNLRWLGLIGLIPLITGLTGYCPLYSLFGICTNKNKES